MSTPINVSMKTEFDNLDFNKRKEFEKELTVLINKYSLENLSGTPDHILSRFLVNSLIAFGRGVRARESWYK